MSVCEQKNVAGSVYVCMCSQVLVFCGFRFWFFQRDVILISFFWSSLPLRINQVFDLKSPLLPERISTLLALANSLKKIPQLQLGQQFYCFFF